MKKLLFLLMCVTLVTASFAQKVDSVSTDTSQYVTNSDTEKLVDKYSAKIEATIVSLAQTLKTPAEHVYKILVKQQVVYAIEATVVQILLLIVLIILWYLYYQEAKKNQFDSYKISGWLTTCCVFSCIFVILSVICVSYMVSGFVNPEYGAIKDIAKLIR